MAVPRRKRTSLNDHSVTDTDTCCPNKTLLHDKQRGTENWARTSGMKYRFPELMLGALLTAAVFSVGMVFSSLPQNNTAHAIDHPATPDDRIANYTLWLAILTGGLVLVSAGQGYFLLRADRTARMTAEAAQAQTRNFTKLERPYIYIFGAKGLECDFDQEEPYDFLKYWVANYGKTPASLESAKLTINVGKSPGSPEPMAMWHDLVVRPILIPNERRDDLTAIVPYGIQTSQYADEHCPPGSFTVPDLEDGTDFFFWIAIKYRGPFSVGHETSACWRWDRDNARLILFGGEEYNFTR
jgi:hypothetical protein